MAKSTKKLSLAAFGLIGGIVTAALAQTPAFTGFTPGNLIVSRTVYAGTASTIAVGQALPPVCPATATCGTAKATDDGTYPTAGSTNNVWNNNKADGSFGITSPIFLDQITPTGTAVSTLPIPPNMVTTSFSSKSELALNVSGDGSAITFMAYIASPNTVDVSNSNTPGVYDATNPAGGSYYRSVVQVGANGAIQVTPTNAYSGNNGRAAVLANGQYYMVGNANNGGGTPENVVESTGVQMATPGQPASTYPTAVGDFSITQLNGPSGTPYPADKLGKDNNFRGLTLFNNTLFVTKGSGGNGVDTVYQVGNSGTLPTLGNALSAPVKILPGFPQTLATNANATTIYPFGLFFANATTLYVADEGNGALADVVTSKTAGLQKWSLVGGAWQMDYVLQNGLALGQPYSVTNYPATLNPATGGLRNIAGKVNTDGTVTIWGVTSTVSTNGDQGADPNKLVSITDTLANLTAAGAASAQFNTIKSAAAGEVLRGVSLTPAAGSTPAVNAPLILSAASPSVIGIAQGSIATANGQNLSVGTPGAAPTPSPTILGGVSIAIVDAGGRTTAAPLIYVSPTQINFVVPATVATGIAQVTVTTGAGTQTGTMEVGTLAPGVFTLNGTALAAAYAVRVSANGTQTAVPVFNTTAGANVAAPISLGAATDKVYITLYGTGLQAAGTKNVTATVGGVNAPVLFAGPQGVLGVDQVNVQIPAGAAGKGNVSVQLYVSGIPANPVQITVQ